MTEKKQQNIREIEQRLSNLQTAETPLVDSHGSKGTKGKVTRRSFGLAAMAALAFLLVGLAGGFYAGQEYREASDRVDRGQSWADQVAQVQKLYTPESFQGVLLGEQQKKSFDDWLVARLGLGPQLPELSALGFSLADATVLQIDEEPAAQLIYLSEDDAPIGVYILASKGPDRPQTKGRKEGLNYFSWRKNGTSLLVIGAVPKAVLRELSTAYEQWVASKKG